MKGQDRVACQYALGFSLLEGSMSRNTYKTRSPLKNEIGRNLGKSFAPPLMYKVVVIFWGGWGGGVGGNVTLLRHIWQYKVSPRILIFHFPVDFKATRPKCTGKCFDYTIFLYLGCYLARFVHQQIFDAEKVLGKGHFFCLFARPARISSLLRKSEEGHWRIPSWQQRLAWSRIRERLKHSRTHTL